MKRCTQPSNLVHAGSGVAQETWTKATAKIFCCMYGIAQSVRVAKWRITVTLGRVQNCLESNAGVMSEARTGRHDSKNPPRFCSYDQFRLGMKNEATDGFCLF